MSGRLVATEPYIFDEIAILRPFINDLNEYDNFYDALESVDGIIVENHRADSGYKVGSRKISQIDYTILTMQPEIRNRLNRHILGINEEKSYEIVDLRKKYEIFTEAESKMMSQFTDLSTVWYSLLAFLVMSAIAYIIKLLANKVKMKKSLMLQ